MLKKVAIILVLLMALIQAFYAAFAFIDPLAFAAVRGTELFSNHDLDWVFIYASRTLFVALIVMLLLYIQHYKALMWAALFGAVMPITDAWLAWQAGSPQVIIIKHLATLVYLLLTFFVLRALIKKQKHESRLFD